MDRYLILLRHAKSSWTDASLSDFERPLNDRGRSAVPLMAGWLDEHSLIPDAMLCSTAVRAQQTANLIVDTHRSTPKRFDLAELYLASPNTIMEAVSRHGPSEMERLMVVGHNPGLEILASMLSGQALTLPTAGLVIFRVRRSTSPWTFDLSDGSLQLEHYITPRKLQPTIDHD